MDKKEVLIVTLILLIVSVLFYMNFKLYIVRKSCESPEKTEYKQDIYKIFLPSFCDTETLHLQSKTFKLDTSFKSFTFLNLYARNVKYLHVYENIDVLYFHDIPKKMYLVNDSMIEVKITPKRR